MIDEKELKEKLFKDRTLIICGDIDNNLSTQIIFSLLQLDSLNKEEIQLFISSNGGDYLSSMAIYDTMKLLKSEIRATCVGNAGGYAALILSSATKGKRFALKHSKINLEQPYGVINGGANQETDVRINANEVKIEREIFEKILSKNTSKSIEDIHTDLEQGLSLNADEACKYGLIDDII